MIVLRESAYHAVPWKNGGGITREIYREPAGSAAFDWRRSLATIDRPAISTAGWLETPVCCVSGPVRITNIAAVSEDPGAVDTARCGPSDGIVICSPVGIAVTQIFIAAVFIAAVRPARAS
jgi:hypothetical protein